MLKIYLKIFLPPVITITDKTIANLQSSELSFDALRSLITG